MPAGGAKPVDWKRQLESSKVLILQHKVNSRHGRLLTAALLAGGLYTTNFDVQARTYRWVDETGEVVYSQLPPPPGHASTVIGDPPPPAEAPEVIKQRLQEQLQQVEDRREDQQLADEKSAKEQQSAAEAARLCQAARENLRNLEQGPGNRLYRDSDGEYRRLTDETRAAKQAEARDVIEKYCK